MKNLLFLLWLLPAACLAQTDSTIAKPHYIYCRIFLTGGVMFTKTYYKADFGKKSSSVYFSEDEYKKLNEQLANFNSEVDALNYMDLQGWEFVNSTALKDADNVYLLRKRIKP